MKPDQGLLQYRGEQEGQDVVCCRKQKEATLGMLVQLEDPDSSHGRPASKHCIIQGKAVQQVHLLCLASMKN